MKERPTLNREQQSTPEVTRSKDQLIYVGENTVISVPRVTITFGETTIQCTVSVLGKPHIMVDSLDYTPGNNQQLDQIISKYFFIPFEADIQNATITLKDNVEKILPTIELPSYKSKITGQGISDTTFFATYFRHRGEPGFDELHGNNSKYSEIKPIAEAIIAEVIKKHPEINIPTLETQLVDKLNNEEASFAIKSSKFLSNEVLKQSQDFEAKTDPNSKIEPVFAELPVVVDRRYKPIPLPPLKETFNGMKEPEASLPEKQVDNRSIEAKPKTNAEILSELIKEIIATPQSEENRGLLRALTKGLFVLRSGNSERISGILSQDEIELRKVQLRLIRSQLQLVRNTNQAIQLNKYLQDEIAKLNKLEASITAGETQPTEVQPTADSTKTTLEIKPNTSKFKNILTAAREIASSVKTKANKILNTPIESKNITGIVGVAVGGVALAYGFSRQGQIPELAQNPINPETQTQKTELVKENSTLGKATSSPRSGMKPKNNIGNLEPKPESNNKIKFTENLEGIKTKIINYSEKDLRAEAIQTSESGKVNYKTILNIIQKEVDFSFYNMIKMEIEVRKTPLNQIMSIKKLSDGSFDITIQL